MMGWKLTSYSLGDRTGRNATGKIHFQVQSCSFRRSAPKDGSVSF